MTMSRIMSVHLSPGPDKASSTGHFLPVWSKSLWSREERPTQRMHRPEPVAVLVIRRRRSCRSWTCLLYTSKNAKPPKRGILSWWHFRLFGVSYNCLRRDIFKIWGRNIREKKNDKIKQRNKDILLFNGSPATTSKTTKNELVNMHLLFEGWYNKGRQSHFWGWHTSAFYFDPYLRNKGHWV